MSPPTVDLRPAMPPVRDQGKRGTCLAFAVTAAHEVSRSGGAIPDDLSEEALYWGCKRTDGDWARGTTYASASVVLNRWGQPLETVWPYDATRPDGVEYKAPVRPGGKDWFRGTLKQVGIDLDEVRALLDSSTPVALDLTVFDTLYKPSANGRVSDPPVGAPARGRHAVLAVGHQPAEFLIRNSWGTDWAFGGYAWIGDDYVQNHGNEAWVIDPGDGTTPAPATKSAVANQGETYGAR